MPELNEEFIEDFLADPQKYKRRWFEEIRREYPDMTEEQLEASWKFLAVTMGVD